MQSNRSNETQMPLAKDAVTRSRRKGRGLALLGAGLFTLALLAMAGMGSVAPAAHADGPAVVVVKTPPPTRTPVRPRPNTLLGPSCPAGTILVMFDMPVYGPPPGYFVVGYTPVPYCVPEGLEPAG
jgi:hypothetical protein